MKKIAVLVVGLLALLMLSVVVEGAEPEVCGGEHLAPPLVDLGEGEYCVKGGSSQSQGCSGYLATGGYDEVNAVVGAEGACGLSHWSFDPAELPTTTATAVEPTATPVTPTSTLEPSATPTEPEPTATEPEPTNLPPTPTNPPNDCGWEPVGELFKLVSESGEVVWLASFSPHPNGGYYIPNVEAQQSCAGFVAANVPDSRLLYRNTCTGEYSEYLVRCQGGAGACLGGIYD